MSIDLNRTRRWRRAWIMMTVISESGIHTYAEVRVNSAILPTVS